VGVTELIDCYLEDLPSHAVVAIASKVVSLCENRVVAASESSKRALVEAESERERDTLNTAGPHDFRFTITQNTLIPSAGIGESNVGGGYLLWPADPQRTANAMRSHLSRRTGAKHVGVVITDSTCTPLRRGTSGICLAHSGFRALNDYIGKPDLFGRPFRVGLANVAAGLAAAAVLAVGEGAERTPICVIDDVPFVRVPVTQPHPARTPRCPDRSQRRPLRPVPLLSHLERRWPGKPGDA
jgi:dihydrofolate synthase / folylpolyglutamate synthase